MTTEKVKGGGVFTVKCVDKDGNLKWVEQNHNLVVNVGLQDMNDKFFRGSAYTAEWYVGLYGPAATNDPDASDTIASHAGWVEDTGYSQPTRPPCVFGPATVASPSVISNGNSVATFNINTTTTIGGAFLCSDDTKGGTTGVLFSASDFGPPGDRNVTDGDILLVTYEFSLTAA